MAKKNDSNLIGHDPLAWMNAPAEESLESVATADITTVPESANAPVSSANDASMALSAETPEPSTDEEAVSTDLVEPVVNETVTKLVLAASQTIQNVAQLHEQLIEKVNLNTEAIDIDASQIKNIDTATLQLFVLFCREMQQQERAVTFDFPSEAFVESAELLGIASLLGVDNSVSGFF